MSRLSRVSHQLRLLFTGTGGRQTCDGRPYSQGGSGDGTHGTHGTRPYLLMTCSEPSWDTPRDTQDTARKSARVSLWGSASERR